MPGTKAEHGDLRAAPQPSSLAGLCGRIAHSQSSGGVADQLALLDTNGLSSEQPGRKLGAGS